MKWEYRVRAGITFQQVFIRFSEHIEENSCSLRQEQCNVGHIYIQREIPAEGLSSGTVFIFSMPQRSPLVRTCQHSHTRRVARDLTESHMRRLTCAIIGFMHAPMPTCLDGWYRRPETNPETNPTTDPETNPSGQAPRILNRASASSFR